jgi:small subunit ribosomal protein S8
MVTFPAVRKPVGSEVWRVNMSMQDTVADMLTRIRNAQMAKHPKVKVSLSKLNASIADVLKKEGFIAEYHVETQDGIQGLVITLKYYEGRPVIDKIQRISRPGLRVYTSCAEIKPVSRFGLRILSTPKGVLTDKDAKGLGIGGEVLCEVA